MIHFVCMCMLLDVLDCFSGIFLLWSEYFQPSTEEDDVTKHMLTLMSLVVCCVQLDVFLAMLIAALFFCMCYCLNKICPRVQMYSPLELDEIRLERAADREGILAGKIDKMKVHILTYVEKK